MISEKNHTDSVYENAKANQRFTFVVDLNSYQQNMVLAESVYNANGGIIVFENSVLSSQMINKLGEHGITKIKIYYKTFNLTLADDLKNFELKYLQALYIFKEIIKDIFAGRKVNIIKIEQIANYIMEMGSSNSFVLKHEVVDNPDEYLYTHSINVGILSMLIAKWFKFDDIKTKALIKSAILHDIGKCRVDQSILNKQGPLLQNEYIKVKEHVYHGLAILKDLIPSRDICMGVFMHHERCDGSGYPKGLMSSGIHEFAKIIAVVDVYDAMTSNRVYRRKQSPFDVFEHIQKSSMTGLDIKITLSFLKNISNYYLGDTFLLNSGELCKIVYNNPLQISRPLIKIGERYVDLSKDNELKITAIA